MAWTLPTDVADGCDGLLYCFAEWAHNVTSGAFWFMMLLAFGIVLIMATINRFGFTRSFGFGAISTALGALWLATLQLMPWWTASAFILTGGISLVVMIMSQR